MLTLFLTKYLNLSAWQLGLCSKELEILVTLEAEHVSNVDNPVILLENATPQNLASPPTLLDGPLPRGFVPAAREAITGSGNVGLRLTLMGKPSLRSREMSGGAPQRGPYPQVTTRPQVQHQAPATPTYPGQQQEAQEWTCVPPPPGL